MAIVAKFGLALTASILLVNLVLYCILLGLAGWAFNEFIDGKLVDTAVNAASPYLIIFSILSGVLGITSVVCGLQTLSGKTENNAAAISAASATGLAAWGVTLIALGLASKQIHIGLIHNKKLKVLEAFAIILAGAQLLYLIVAHVTLHGKTKSAANTAPAEPHTKSATAV
ncbi:hypothetical protein O6H91_12G033800 [Diphasiastrum complanatum]|uniref:Uncharacterized protein n=1 Tax=Diphasiastrum complanatum TaxID=34168 RepID=A0ACC2C072_DIPCM|nr:hypothetical protein O6H91_12G033800 [Diphasiastrum complanatum]